MGKQYVKELEDAATEAKLDSDAREIAAGDPSVDLERPADDASGGASEAATQPRPKGLHVQAGAALSSFDAGCWPVCFTEFSYGDCAPNLERQAHLTSKLTFCYLMMREELEYSLEDDEETYRAKAMCR